MATGTREYCNVTLNLVGYLADISVGNPGPLFMREGDVVDGSDAHVRLYDPETHILVGVFCGHSNQIDPGMGMDFYDEHSRRYYKAHVARNGSVFCPHSAMREECQ